MTKKTSLDSIPVFDLNDFEKDKEKFAREFGQAFHDYGFVRIKNHGIDESTIEDAEDVIRKFFQMDDDKKTKYSFPEHQYQVGFTKNNEMANGQTKADLKEYFMVCRDKRREADVKTPETPEIDELPKFREDTYSLYYEFNKLVSKVLKPLAMHMGEQEDWFEKRNDKSEDMMRMIHYPSGGNAASHTDMSLLTILRAEKPGLFVTTRTGEELEVTAKPGELILNGGKALAALTNNYFKPSYHRVDVKSKDPRQTIVYFAHINSDCMLDTVPKFKGYNGGLKNEDWFKRLSRFPILYRDYANERLAKNFAKPQQKKKGPKPPKAA
tara:strand:+ start:4397 stop:5371 length:975 start_codon:yes stop_codon:yes gene_type:complete